ncbi:DUF1080 domain-containing protein [Lentisphaera profundi]|uniref:DUF1080 domain-containing protein n=1 Tax=Lentisphaera profundi TaxID=1658616 RepID=A0ABY7W1G0_9BACT|nr:DUF1080 domain-containing protein [Lentisphaera profundi]WDE99404.1 DUF1080 domain-containing protein [Lentisphaera profundi]
MKYSLFTIVSLFYICCASIFAADKPYQVKLADAKLLFNGKDLTGWIGNPKFWSVNDGAIYGSTHVNRTAGNTFLILDAEDVEDFHLVYEAKCVNHNSGVMYRSVVLDKEKFTMKGYQCDLHPSTNYCAMLYGERERGIITTRGQKMVIDKSGNKKVISYDPPPKVDIAQWNTYEVICKGSKITHKVNGKFALELTDNWTGRIKKGKIGLQLHAGEAMEVYFRNIKLKRFEKASQESKSGK